MGTVYSAVWRPSTEGEIQVYDWKLPDLRAKYDELWNQGWRLHLLQPYVVNDQVLWAAVWRPSTEGEIQVYDWKLPDLRAKYDELWNQGWRLHLLQPYVVNDQVLWAAVWRPSTEGEIQVYDWDLPGLMAKYNELFPQGYRLHLLQPYALNGQVRWAAVWRPSTEGEIVVYDQPYSGFRSMYDELWNQGWRLHLLDTFQLAPMDLFWEAVDANGIPKNPKWGYQILFPGELPNPGQLCPNNVFQPPCTTQAPTQDSTFFCGPHVNWFAGTYEGPIFWESHSGPPPFEDDDYSLNLTPPDQAGLTTANGGGTLHLEFDSRETINHFHTPWWESFHHAVDNSDNAARQMIDGHFSIVTGLIGLDCPHGCKSESHPVWAIAIEVNAAPTDQVWAMFVRNWGNEGFCASNQHYLDVQSFTFQLPWKAGATSVSIGAGTQFLTNNAQATGPSVQFTPNEGVLATFTLPPPEAGARVNGELHLQWVIPNPGQDPTRQVASPPSRSEESAKTDEDELEDELAPLVAQLTLAQRQEIIKRFPQESLTVDEIVPTRSEAAVLAPPLLVMVASSRLPRVRAVSDLQKKEEDQRKLDALRSVLGDKVPPFPSNTQPS